QPSLACHSTDNRRPDLGISRFSDAILLRWMCLRLNRRFGRTDRTVFSLAGTPGGGGIGKNFVQVWPPFVELKSTASRRPQAELKALIAISLRFTGLTAIFVSPLPLVSLFWPTAPGQLSPIADGSEVADMAPERHQRA